MTATPAPATPTPAMPGPDAAPGPFARAGGWWNRFWFRPVSTTPVALVRAVYGIVVLAWAISLLPDVAAFFSDHGVDGMVREPVVIDGLLALYPSLALAVGTVLVLVAAAGALAVGWHSRLASAVVFVAIVTLQRRNPFVLNSGDALLRHIAFYLMLAPTGAALSVDRWRCARERFWSAPERSPWALRLLQIQLSVVYLSTVWDKWQGATWRDGTAVHYVWRIADLARFPVPDAVASSEFLVAASTYGTLGVEVAVAVLIWHRRTRPWVAAAGLAMHAVIAATLRVGFFSLAMGCLYVAFVPPPAADRLVDRLRRILARRTVTRPPPEIRLAGHSRSPVFVPSNPE